MWIVVTVAAWVPDAQAAEADVKVVSPDQRNAILLTTRDDDLTYSVIRDGHLLFGPSRIGTVLSGERQVTGGVKIVDVQQGQVDQSFSLVWGKSDTVTDRCEYAVVTLSNMSRLRWQMDLRAYDDGVALRYRLLAQEGLSEFEIRAESTRFDPVGNPQVMFNTLDGFTSSHESLYEFRPMAEVPAGKLIDCPVLCVWPDGTAAAITEARVRDFAGMYLMRSSEEETGLQCRLSPLPSHAEAAVASVAPHESPWRVVMLGDSAGKLIESNLLLCLNDPPREDFSWARPGKTTFDWWYGEFEDDHQLDSERDVYVARHKKYIDFCAQNNIAYHTISGDGFAWYEPRGTSYSEPQADADVLRPRPELGLPEILDYARQREVGIRLWIHWKPLSQKLEEAMRQFESWGVQGLMVDFLDRDDQDMIQFVERLLECAARHKLNVQIHGSSKFSGEQRTFPNLFNREGVLNLEYLKWSDLCTPAHNVNVAFTRALTGPVDYHLGGLRCVTRSQFVPRQRAPLVMGTRCHNLALYVVYENPMPMVADAPGEYQGQIGFEFLKATPTRWDETRFLVGEPGEFIAVARRNGDRWFVGGITNWTSRRIDVPMSFLGTGTYGVRLWTDDPSAAADPNAVERRQRPVTADESLRVFLASGGGFTAIAEPL